MHTCGRLKQWIYAGYWANQRDHHEKQQHKCQSINPSSRCSKRLSKPNDCTAPPPRSRLLPLRKIANSSHSQRESMFAQADSGLRPASILQGQAAEMNESCWQGHTIHFNGAHHWLMHRQASITFQATARNGAAQTPTQIWISAHLIAAGLRVSPQPSPAGSVSSKHWKSFQMK